MWKVASGASKVSRLMMQIAHEFRREPGTLSNASGAVCACDTIVISIDQFWAGQRRVI